MPDVDLIPLLQAVDTVRKEQTFLALRAAATDKAAIHDIGRISFSDIGTKHLLSVLAVIPEPGDAPVYSYRIEADQVFLDEFKAFL